MQFETIVGRSKQITIDGKEYTASVLSVSELDHISGILHQKALLEDKTARKLPVYDMAINLIFHNPAVAIWAAIAKNDPTIEFKAIANLNLASNPETAEFVAYLVGISLEKKTLDPQTTGEIQHPSSPTTTQK